MEKRLLECFERLNFRVDNFLHQLDTIAAKIKSFEEKIDMLEVGMRKIDRSIEQLKRKSKLRNIILYNVPSESGENHAQLMSKVMEIFKSFLDIVIKPEDITFIQRVGSPKPNKHPSLHPPVRIRFESQSIKTLVSKRLANFRTSPFNASDDFTKEMLHQRKLLYPRMMEARRNGQHAVLKNDSLFINGKKLITVSECPNLHGNSSSSSDHETSPVRRNPEKCRKTRKK